jgi:hypothetical protein
LVIVCTTTGAPPPTWTPPTFTERSEATPPVYEGLSRADAASQGSGA